MRRPLRPERSVDEAWQRLVRWASARDLWTPDRICLNIAHDNPKVTEPAKCRLDAAIVIPQDFKADGDVNVTDVAGGKCAAWARSSARRTRSAPPGTSSSAGGSLRAAISPITGPASSSTSGRVPRSQDQQLPPPSSACRCARSSAAPPGSPVIPPGLLHRLTAMLAGGRAPGAWRLAPRAALPGPPLPPQTIDITRLFPGERRRSRLTAGDPCTRSRHGIHLR